MFDEKNSAAIYLDRNIIVFVAPSKEILQELHLEKEIFNHLEVKNEEKFIQVIKTFVEQFPSQDAVIFLSKSILFEREVSLNGKEEASDKEIEKFLSMIPITNNKLSSKVLEDKDAALCLGTNKEYYELIIKGAAFAGINISAVVPAFLFEGLEENGVFVPEQIINALGDHKQIEESNFLNQKMGQPDIPETADIAKEDRPNNEVHTQSRSKTIILTLVLVGLLSFSVIFSYFNGLFDRFIPGKVSPEEDEVSTSQIVLPTNPIMDSTQSGVQASASAITIEELRTKITNGTGVSGQAARAQDALAPLRMKETLLDQESTKGAVATRLGYDPQVPLSIVDEVKKTLLTIFVSVEEKEASDTGEFDLLIVTGKEKK